MRAGAAHPMGTVVLYFCLSTSEHNAWHINTMHHLSVLQVRKLNLVTAGLHSTSRFKGRVFPGLFQLPEASCIPRLTSLHHFNLCWCPHISTSDSPPALLQRPCDDFRPIQTIQDNPPISRPLIESHLWSPFCQVSSFCPIHRIRR